MEKGKTYSLAGIPNSNNAFNVVEFVGGMYRNKIVKEKKVIFFTSGE